MTLKIAELHHHAVRMAPGPDAASATLRFYREILGLELDQAPRDRAEDGQRLNAGPGAQIHLVAPPTRGTPAPGEFDPHAPHVAFAVAAIDEAQAELDRLAVPYRVV